MSYRLKQYVERNFDELTIAGAMSKVIAGRDDLDADDELVIEACRRSTPELAGADIGQIREYLDDFDDAQLTGVASNVKGIAHEIRYVELENADGDTVSAVLFGSPTHPATDILVSDDATGDTWELQLKATEDATGVREWIEAHPESQIQVTTELADRLGIDSSGLSNDELTTDVDCFLDKALEDPSLWDYFPHLTVASTALIVYRVFRRYQQGRLSWSELQWTVAKATGWKIAKISALLALLSVPVINVVTGTALVAKLILSGKELLVRRL